MDGTLITGSRTPYEERSAMISLEQVKLLESKVAKAIDYVKRVTEENKRLEATLESYQKRIDELEVLVQGFKEDQGKIEEGILAALDRLNQFEDAIEKSLSKSKDSGGERRGGTKASSTRASHEAAPTAAFSPPPPAEEVLESPGGEEETAAEEPEDEELEAEEEQEAGEAELDIF
jgi:hypothetical protein